MKFICLGYADYSLFAAMSKAEMSAAMEECFAYDDELRRGGHFLGGEALQAAHQAVTMRYQSGKAFATDGPYAETKEQLGGILLLEARDMPHAIELMSKHPGVKFGPFEIRPSDPATNALIKERDRATSKRVCNPNIELLLNVFEDHLGYITQAVQDIPEARFVDQPNGLVNHPAWTLSHLIVSLQFLLALLDEPQASASKEDQQKYGPGSIPTTNANDYKTKRELLSEMKRLHELAEIAVRDKHDAYFQRESPQEIRKFAPTVGRVAVYLLASHEAYHLAQINLWRRLAGMTH
jgi:hypothetical protein